MDQNLSGLGVAGCSIDDLMVATRAVEEHLSVLEEVFARLDKHGVVLARAKCKFLQTRVTFVGHTVGPDGVQPLHEKVNAVKKAPQPKPKD